MTTSLILQANALHIPLQDESVQCAVTSPPYWGLRDYGIDGQLGLEQTPDAYIANMVQVFREVWRVLRADGTLWVNIGDSYATGTKGGVKSKEGDKNFTSKGTVGMKPVKTQHGVKDKDLVGIPWMLAFALRADGWYLRQEIIWNKPNPMPESVKDRCTKAHESIFLFAKSERYFFDQDAILEPVSPNTHARLSQNVMTQIGSARANGGAKTNGNMKAVGRRGVQPGNGPDGGKIAPPGTGIKYNSSFDEAVALPVSNRNKRSVWTITTKGFAEAHFATFPPELPETCILAGSRTGDLILDPFNGSGTTGMVTLKHNRRYVGVELNPKYIEMTHRRLAGVQPMLMEVAA